MKIKRIKTEKELKAGHYIRAVINCHGKFWIEHQVLVGKPFNCKSKVMNGERQIKTAAGKSKYYKPDNWYISSLCGEINKGVKTANNPFKTVLIPFSNKAWCFLSKIKDLRDFAEVTNGFRSTDEQYNNALEDYSFTKYMDHQYELEIQNIY